MVVVVVIGRARSGREQRTQDSFGIGFNVEEDMSAGSKPLDGNGTGASLRFRWPSARKSHQESPRATTRKQQPPKAANSHQQLPSATESHEKPPIVTKSNQEPPTTDISHLKDPTAHKQPPRHAHR